MNRYIKGIFLKVHRYYTKDRFVDGDFSACFVTAVLFTSTLNLLNAIVFNITKIEALKFNLSPLGVSLLIVIGVLTSYFSYNRSKLLGEADMEYSKAENQFMNIVILFMLSTWVLAPVLYKMGAT